MVAGPLKKRTFFAASLQDYRTFTSAPASLEGTGGGARGLGRGRVAEGGHLGLLQLAEIVSKHQEKSRTEHFK